MSYYLIIPILFGIWACYVTFVLIEKDESFLRARLRNVGKKYKSSTKKILEAFAEIMKPFSVNSIKDKKIKNKIKQMLTRVGAPSSEDDILDFENKRLMILLSVSLICAVALTIKFNNVVICLVIVAIYIAYKAPEMKLQKIINKREKDFEKHFADAIDLLSVCVEAGLGLDSAIERVGREFKAFSPTVGYEFLRLSQDVASGIQRQDALKGLTNRIRCRDLQSFVALIIQSEKLGTGIANSLQMYCDTLRSRRKQRVEELVSSSSTKMTIPMVLFLLPAMFIVILYPAVMEIMEAMKHF